MDDGMMAGERFARVRAICLELPEAAERETWSEATFRVREKIFEMGHDGETTPVTCKGRPGVQQMLVAADPERFYVPPYTGHNGWIGVRLSVPVDWEELEDLITESYRLTAPKRLSTLIAPPEGAQG